MGVKTKKASGPFGGGWGVLTIGKEVKHHSFRQGAKNRTRQDGFEEKTVRKRNGKKKELKAGSQVRGGEYHSRNNIAAGPTSVVRG